MIRYSLTVLIVRLTCEAWLNFLVTEELAWSFLSISSTYVPLTVVVAVVVDGFCWKMLYKLHIDITCII